jgi:hypothetical protein
MKLEDIVAIAATHNVDVKRLRYVCGGLTFHSGVNIAP